MSEAELPSTPEDASHLGPNLPEGPPEGEYLFGDTPPGPPKVRIEAMAMMHSGPLPHPMLLQGYEAAMPGATARIFAMAEAQAAHRIDIERTVIRSNSFSQRVASITGCLLGTILVIGSLLLLYQGKSVAGLASLVISLGSFAAVFFTAKAQQSDDLGEKREQQEKALSKPDQPAPSADSKERR